ncbi:hypothetical protein HPB50_001619 [Hyalomma asiaticum]|uniref:Uncharacterized protein n=1 Tax=Hyalomma asiaticum TaxID=266040 RepID=A0ACB7RYM6_HYAAI|nr:hypothetical protein HPB50_001619 [Hyalomma asiaticum]
MSWIVDLLFDRFDPLDILDILDILVTACFFVVLRVLFILDKRHLRTKKVAGLRLSFDTALAKDKEALAYFGSVVLTIIIVRIGDYNMSLWESGAIQQMQQLMFELPRQRKIISVILVQVVIVIIIVMVAHHRGKRGPAAVYCDTLDCNTHAGELYTSMDDSVHPCRSFYGFVCGRWSRMHSRDDLLEEIQSKAVDIALRQLDTVASRASKVSSFYHSCMDSREQRDENVRVLVALKKELGLRWPEQPRGSDHPLSVMLRMAIRWNLNFLFDVQVLSRRDSHALFIARGFPSITWQESQEKPLSGYRHHVEEHFNVLNVKPYYVNYTELWLLEDAIIQAKLEVMHDKPVQDCFPIGNIGNRTPSIQTGLWLRLLNRYFQGRFTWTSDSFITAEHYKILENLEKLLHTYGEDKLAMGLSWIFIQTHLWVVYDKPGLQFKRSDVTIKGYACLDYVNRYFGLQSVVDHLEERYASTEVRKKVEALPDRIKRTAVKKIREATWMTNDTRENYARKVASIEMSILPPSDFFSVKGRESIYGSFPPMNGSSFMANLVTVANFVASLVTHERYEDIYSRSMSATYGPARYVHPINSVIVPMNALEPPMYYLQVNPPIDYGGLGSYLAREVSKSFDPDGVTDEYGNDTIWSEITNGSVFYKRNSNCEFNNVAGTTGRNDKRVDLFPSLPALEIAFAAYKEAASEEFAGITDARLRSLEKLSGDQLFFMTYCHVMCSVKAKESMGICDASLMNFHPFAEAYRCPIGSPMNPPDKCSYFSGN